MAATLVIERAGPLVSIQDAGRFGYLAHGISASGPMDAGAFKRAGVLAGSGGAAGIEFSMLGLDLLVAEGEAVMGWDGGTFEVSVNGRTQSWPSSVLLAAGDRLTISAGTGGNYGYLRFGGEIDVPLVMGSRATSMRARIGGLDGRALRAGDMLGVTQHITNRRAALGLDPRADAGAAAIEGGNDGPRVKPEGSSVFGVRLGNDAAPKTVSGGPIRFVWGLHAEVFGTELREKFVTSAFRISSMMDRMGVRLRDEAAVFAEARILSLVSDPVVVGDIQILGDGTPIVLGRDHQPTGGYPRIGTIISADLDRFFQLRPNAELVFAPVGLDHAQALLRSGIA
ncbi:biotin-dependent carboxyltransferase family protein [Devosia sp.]|uniref:5-oxoprolinase subunit C family protein n=1 Tax=Devosia sp. TaxID=1871048 RepID=UPI001B1754AC|nr:biotin-dependent carboxyltransferase family protein [Devosia sp.]MBO9587863.1 biotin-dependent carboxyltransferase family protein [Devosia sp.]